LPSRCAEAVRLSRLGHNRERAGREVHPLSGVIGTQRNDRRHVGCIRRTTSFDRSRERLRTNALPQGRAVPYERRGINWITVPAWAAHVDAQNVEVTFTGNDRSVESRPIEAKRIARNAMWRTAGFQSHGPRCRATPKSSDGAIQRRATSSIAWDRKVAGRRVAAQRVPRMGRKVRPPHSRQIPSPASTEGRQRQEDAASDGRTDLRRQAME
jgi:hypothetical protein